MMYRRENGRLSVFSWCLYDWASSAFGTVIITFVYSLYFARVVAGDETHGNVLWNYAIAASGFLMALASPFLGAAADHYGARKGFVLVFTILCVVPAALLWFGAPGAVMLTLVLVVVANFGVEQGIVFYNTMLPHIATPGAMGRLSGIAWGLGYLGGLFCLAAALFLLVGLGSIKPLIALPQDTYAHVRATGPLVALWFAVFALPFFLFTHDNERTGRGVFDSMELGWRQLRETLAALRRHGNLARFLIASAIYRDGLNTLFSGGAIYAGSTLGLKFQEVLLFGIGINVTAGIGAAISGWLDDYIGSKKTALLSLAGLVVSGVAILLVGNKMVFVVIALVLGVFIGPAQSASRTLVARLAPENMVAQTYGLYAFTGKSVSFLGPLCFAAATDIFDSQRAGMATIILFWLAGMALLATVKERK